MKNSDPTAIRMAFITRAMLGITLLFALAYLGSQVAKHFFGPPCLMGATRAVDLDAERYVVAFHRLPGQQGHTACCWADAISIDWKSPTANGVFCSARSSQTGSATIPIPAIGRKASSA